MTETTEKKTKIKGLTLPELEQFALSIGESKFRGNQLFKWMYNNGVTSFDQMSNLPKDLRSYLSENFELNTLTLEKEEVSPTEGTRKLLFKTGEGNYIESVIIPEEKRNTLCISTQVGCPLDCQFCATGLMGYKKNLTAGEIVDQYLNARNVTESHITNIVYMGMGEPLLNFKETVKSLEIFSQELTVGVSSKKITVSTAGIAPKIKELADTGLKNKLALSLHSCYEDIRTKIMPINKKYSLAEVIDACEYYAKTTDTRITWEYVMLAGINDRPEDIRALVKLCKQIPSKVNVIPFNSLEHMNPTGFSAELRPTSKNKINDFCDKLRENNITVIVRETQGKDIAAACGQLAVQF